MKVTFSLYFKICWFSAKDYDYWCMYLYKNKFAWQENSSEVQKLKNKDLIKSISEETGVGQRPNDFFW